MTGKTKFLAWALPVLLPFVLMSCDVSNSDKKSQGTLNVKMHDSPALYDAVTVEIEQVRVNTGNGWEPVMDSSKKVNLLNLINGTFAELGAVELEAGSYQQIRLLLGSDNSVTIEGQTYDLKVPSGQQTGLKINVDFSIESNTTTELLLDFDAKQSVHRTGPPNQLGPNTTFILRPVVNASVRAVTGDIEGTIEPAGSRPWIIAMNESDTVSTTIADSASGNFELTGLNVATYDLVVEPTDTTYADTTIADVQVNANSTTDIGTVVLTQ